MPTLFPVVKATFMPPIRRTQAATRASTTTVHIGSKRAVSPDTGDVGLLNSLESAALNSGNFGRRSQRA